ncbi:MAG TPA: UDP binding domain-containing protein [Actinomycetota bacterium]|nr:UDP binding domain-containing protein [Actinomycetota bacterium]
MVRAGLASGRLSVHTEAAEALAEASVIGGSCFPKDIVALQGMAETRGLHARILRAAQEVNFDQQRWVVRKLQRHLRTLVGRRIGLLGFSFKPHTDDLRNAPALEIAAELSALGAVVKAYDPSVTELPVDVRSLVDLMPDASALARGAEGLVLVPNGRSFRSSIWSPLPAPCESRCLLTGDMSSPQRRHAGRVSTTWDWGRPDSLLPQTRAEKP